MGSKKNRNFGRYIYLHHNRRMITSFEIVKCHGSGNDFILVDTTRDSNLASVDWSAFARVACSRSEGIGSDGVLLVVRDERGYYGMDMLNPDGTHAQMCGNGMRSVARIASERGYLDSGVLFSGGRDFKVRHEAPIAHNIETFSVEIPIERWSSSFAFFGAGEEFVGRTIPELHPTIPFTALSLGNPHIVACVESIDMELLKRWGEEVIERRELFPEGVNVSMYEVLSPRSIFVATYERGAGITLSCGTAMTASATAAALLGYVAEGEQVEVINRGGKVFCTPCIDAQIVTRLEGNATFEWWGEVRFGDGIFTFTKQRITGEQEQWQRFVKEING